MTLHDRYRKSTMSVAYADPNPEELVEAMSTRTVLDAQTLSPEALGELMDLIHDCWFDLEAARHDPLSGIFSLACGNHRRGPFDRRLTISAVQAVHVVDEAGIRFYDIDKVEIDLAASTIALVSGFPLRIQARVGKPWKLELADEDEYHVRRSCEESK